MLPCTVPRIVVQSIGTVTTLCLMHFMMNDWFGVSYVFIANVWGVACIVVFMDSVVLQNDHKMLLNKFEDLKQRYIMLEQFRKEEKMELIEREEKFIRTLSMQSTAMKSEISSLSESMDNLSDKLDLTPERHHSSTSIKIPIMENSNKNPESIKNWKSSHYFSLSDSVINGSVERPPRLGISKSEVICRPGKNETKNFNFGTLNFNIDFSPSLRRSKSSPSLSPE